MDRIPVNVIGIFTSDGKIYPRHFLLHDGHKYNIDHVIDIRPEFSPFSDGTGLRYTVQIRGRKCSMWLEDMVWYIEGTGGVSRCSGQADRSLCAKFTKA